jgi:nickel-dependent lactate racemase
LPSPRRRRGKYSRVQLLNHDWDNPAALRSIGTIPSDEISQLTGRLFAMDVEVKINRRVFDYDQVITIAPVFPHEVVGFPAATNTSSPALVARKS